MGLRDQFRLLTTADLIAASETADLVASLAPVNTSNGYYFNYGNVAAVDRNTAMSVPALSRARNLYSGTIGSLPLETRLRADNSYVESPRVINQPDPRVPGSGVYFWIVEDLLFYGLAYGQVLEVYQEFPNRIKSWTRIQPTRVNVNYNPSATEVTGYSVDGTKVPDRGVGSLVVFNGLDEGLLARGGRTIRTAHELEKAAYNFAQEPAPAMVLKANGINLPAERISKLLESWKASRQTKSTAFLNSGIDLEQFGHSPRDLQMSEQRQYLATEIARLCNIPAFYLNADAGSNMTYANVTQTRRDLIDLSLKPIITVIEQRLSMADFTPQTQRVRFDLNDFLRGTAEERSRVWQTLNSIGALSVEEIRQLEDLV
jgi:HK97 family phage portal protein